MKCLCYSEFYCLLTLVEWAVCFHCRIQLFYLSVCNYSSMNMLPLGSMQYPLRAKSGSNTSDNTCLIFTWSGEIEAFPQYRLPVLRPDTNFLA